ncbi:hypothetical protein IGI39_004933 [Enterococcus sp. AZ135]|uniref:hypothetical protein n=1 Tax=unclassified Enterococcus TaxID=2608891 RepID=UPI003F297BBC
MAVRYGLSVGEDLDKWIQKKAEDLGIAKNAFVIHCVANAREQEANAKMMTNPDTFKQIFDLMNMVSEQEKGEKK